MERRLPLSLAMLLLIALAGCSGTKTDRVAEPEPCDLPGLKNCARAGDVVFSGQPTREGLIHLADQGFRTVVTMRGPRELDWDEAALVDSLGMAFVPIPMPYPIDTITAAQVAALDSVMTQAARPLLLHCSSGNRTAGLWAVWLNERRDVAPSEALRLGRKAGLTRLAPLVVEKLGVEPDMH